MSKNNIFVIIGIIALVFLFFHFRGNILSQAIIGNVNTFWYPIGDKAVLMPFSRNAGGQVAGESVCVGIAGNYYFLPQACPKTIYDVADDRIALYNSQPDGSRWRVPWWKDRNGAWHQGSGAGNVFFPADTRPRANDDGTYLCPSSATSPYACVEYRGWWWVLSALRGEVTNWCGYHWNSCTTDNLSCSSYSASECLCRMDLLKGWVPHHDSVIEISNVGGVTESESVLYNQISWHGDSVCFIQPNIYPQIYKYEFKLTLQRSSVGCTDGQTQPCIVRDCTAQTIPCVVNCSGIQTCSGNVFGSCVRTVQSDPNCGKCACSKFFKTTYVCERK